MANQQPPAQSPKAPAAATTPAAPALTPLEAFKKTLDTLRDDFAKVITDPKQLDRFVLTVCTAVGKNPDLLNADRPSLYSACMDAAQDGLIPDGREAVLNIYNTNVGTKDAPKWVKSVKYMPMVYGILKKVRNSGELFVIDAVVVYKNDEYEAWVDEQGQHFKHKRAKADRGEPILTFAYAVTKDKALYFEEMDESQTEAVRKVSKSAEKGPWASDFKDEMRRKSVLRRLSKRLPMSSDLENVMGRIDAAFDFDNPEKKETPQPKPSRAQKIVESQQPKAAAAPAEPQATPPQTQQAPAAEEEPPL